MAEYQNDRQQLTSLTVSTFNSMELTLHTHDSALAEEFLLLGKSHLYPEADVDSFKCSTDLISHAVRWGLKEDLTSERHSVLRCKGFMAFYGSAMFRDPVGSITDIKDVITQRTQWYRKVHNEIDAMEAVQQAERDANTDDCEKSHQEAIGE